MSTPWFTRALVGMEVGPTGAQFGNSDPTDTRYCSHFDGKEIVRLTLATHSQYLVLWVRDGDFAYYNSKLLPKAPGLGARDPLKEAIQEAKKHKLTLLSYCVVQQGGHFLKAHPEWEMRGADDKPLGRFCYNSGYQEAMKAILAEQLAYGIAGFHIDMLDQGFGPPYGCWCRSCQAQFEKEFRHPLPKGITWDSTWDDFLEFRYLSSKRFEDALLTHVKTINPDATVDFNYHGNPPFSFEVGQRPVQHAGNADFVTGETGVWGFSALGVGLNAEFYRAATPGLPYQVAIQRGVRMYHDQTTRPLNDLRWELFTLLAHGAFVTMVDKTGLDGKLDPVAYQRIGVAFQEALSKQAHFAGEPLYDIGIYFSSRTRDWRGRENPGHYFASFQGAHKACALEHLTFGVVLDENATLQTLQRFPVVCVPNATILSDTEVALFRRYVEEGGHLIVTGHSGTEDRWGKLLSRSALSELIGAKLKGRLDSLDNWVRSGKGSSPLTSLFPTGAPTDWAFLVKGPASVYEPTTARAFGELLKPFRTTRQREGREGTEWPMSADSPVGPAVLLNPLGKGSVLTFACSPDYATASEHQVVEARQLLTRAARLLNPRPRIQVKAPASVEVVVRDEPTTRTLRVHLLGYNPTPQTTPERNRPFVLPGLIEDAPLYRATVQLAQAPQSVQALNPTTVLKKTRNTIEATINDIHEVLVIRY